MKRAGIFAFCGLAVTLLGADASARKVNWQAPASLNPSIGVDTISSDGDAYEIKVLVPDDAGIATLRVIDPAIRGRYEDNLGITPSMEMCIRFLDPDGDVLPNGSVPFTSDSSGCDWVNNPLYNTPYPAEGVDNSVGGCAGGDCCDLFEDPEYVEYRIDTSGPNDGGVYTISIDSSPNCNIEIPSSLRTGMTGYEFIALEDPGGSGETEIDTYLTHTGVGFVGNTSGTAYPDVTGGNEWYLYAYTNFFSNVTQLNSFFNFRFTSPGLVVNNRLISASTYDQGAGTYVIDKYALLQDPARYSDCAFGQIEYGAWQVDFSISKPGGGFGFAVIACDDFTSTGPSSLSNALRGFQAPASGTLGGRPYVRQLLNYVSGPNPRPSSATFLNPTVFDLIVEVIVPQSYGGAIEFGNSGSGTCDTPSGPYPAPQHDVTLTEPTPTNGSLSYTFSGINFSPSGQTFNVNGTTVRWIPNSAGGGTTSTMNSGEWATMVIPVRITSINTNTCLRVTEQPGNAGALRGGWRNKAAYPGSDGCVFPYPTRDRGGSTTTTDSGDTGTGEGELEGDPPTDASPTYASVTDLAVFVAGGRAVATWQTTAEAGTAAFRVEQIAGQTEEWSPAGPWIAARPDTPQGASYTSDLFVSPAAGDTLRLRIVEAEARGGSLVHGPYRIVAEGGPLGPRGVVPGPMVTRTAPQGELIPPAVPSVRPLQVMRPTLRLEVENEGLYRLRPSDVAPVFGVPAETAAQWMRDRELILSHSPAFSQTSETRYFVDGDDILFYADEPSRIEARNRIYFLHRYDEGETGTDEPQELNATPEPLAPEVTEYLHESVYEEDTVAATAAVTAPGDELWMWNFLLAGQPTADSVSYPFDVSDLGTGDASVRVELRGGNDTTEVVDHSVVVRLNGSEIGRTDFSSLNRAFVDVTVPAGMLLEGGNTLSVEAELLPEASFSVVYVDQFRVRYPRTYRLAPEFPSLRAVEPTPGTIVLENYAAGTWILDVTNPDTPIRLLADVAGSVARLTSGGRRLTAVDPVTATSPINVRLAQPHDVQQETGGEYVVIAPQAWRGVAEAFASRHQDRGLTWTVVDIERISDSYGDGYPSGQAVRQFLVDAYNYWPNRPRMVLLLGDGSYDLRNLRGNGDAIIPSMFVPTRSGLFASDTALGDVEGVDGVPEIAIGRVPVLSALEAEHYLAKVLAFESTTDDTWQESALVMADNPDDGGGFTANAWSLQSLLSDFAGVDILLLENTDADTMRQQAIDRISSGARLVHYAGHAGSTQLAAEGILSVADVQLLRNVGRPTILSAASCLLSRYELPGFTTFAEQLLLMPDVGAVAAFAPMGLEYTERSKGVTRAFGVEVLNRNAEYLAAAYLAGIGQTANVLADRQDTRHQFNLLGDPALALTAPQVISEVTEPRSGGGCQQFGGTFGGLALCALVFLLGSAIRRRRWR